MSILQTKAVTPATLGASGTATWTSTELDGYSLHRLVMNLGGTFTKAMITNIRVKIAGKVIIDSVTGTQLDQMNQWDTNIADDATVLNLFFGNPGMSDYYGKHAGDLDLSVIKDKSGGPANIEVSVTYSGATSPTLAIYADVELPKARNKTFKGGEGALVKTYIHTQLNPGSAITRQQQTIGFGQHASAGVETEYWFHGGNMTSLQVYKDSAIILDDIAQALQDSVNKQYNHPAISHLYVWSPTLQRAIGKLENSLKGANTPSGAVNVNPQNPAIFRHLLSTSASDTIDVYAKVMVPFAQL